MKVHNYYPSTCPSCGESYVNSTLSGLLWFGLIILSGVLAFWVYRESEVPTWVMLAIVVVVTPSYALLVKPIPYSKFKAYGKRPVWKNILIFGVMPLVLISIILTVVVKFGGG